MYCIVQRFRSLSGATILAFKLFVRRLSVLETNYVLIKKSKSQFVLERNLTLSNGLQNKIQMKFTGNYKHVYAYNVNFKWYSHSFFFTLWYRELQLNTYIYFPARTHLVVRISTGRKMQRTTKRDCVQLLNYKQLFVLKVASCQ